MIKPRQVKAARAILGWGMRDLGARTDLTPGTIARIESGKEAMAASLRKIEDAFRGAGIDFPDAYTVTYRRLEDQEGAAK